MLLKLFFKGPFYNAYFLVTTQRNFKIEFLSLEPSLVGEGWGEENSNNSLLQLFCFFS